MYVLNINEENRILSACYDNEYIDASLPRVETLPDGDIYDYLYLENEYVYSPEGLPEVTEESEDSECPLEGVEE